MLRPVVAIFGVAGRAVVVVTAAALVVEVAAGLVVAVAPPAVGDRGRFSHARPSASSSSRCGSVGSRSRAACASSCVLKFSQFSVSGLCAGGAATGTAAPGAAITTGAYSTTPGGRNATWRGTAVVVGVGGVVLVVGLEVVVDELAVAAGGGSGSSQLMSAAP